MNTSSDAAEQIVRISLEGFEAAVKITGSSAKNIAALICAVMKDKNETLGKTALSNMLKSGKDLKVFSIKQQDFKKFATEAKRYGVLYSALINKRQKDFDGIIDVMVKSEDSAKINRIMDRFKLSTYSKNVEAHNKVKEQDENELPQSVMSEKSPRSKPSLKMPKTSDRGINKKQSVKSKLEKAKILSDSLLKIKSKSKVRARNNRSRETK